MAQIRRHLLVPAYLGQTTPLVAELQVGTQQASGNSPQTEEVSRTAPSTRSARQRLIECCDQRTELWRARFDAHAHAELLQCVRGHRPDGGNQRAIEARSQRIGPPEFVRHVEQIVYLRGVRESH